MYTLYYPETGSDVRKTKPDLPETASNVRKTKPDLPETGSDVRKTKPDLPETGIVTLGRQELFNYELQK